MKERSHNAGSLEAILAIAFIALLSRYEPLKAQSTAPQEEIAAIMVSLRSHRYEEAVSQSNVALQTSPRDHRLWTLEGIAFAGKGDKTSALNAFRNALAISPDYRPALKAEARLLYESRDQRAVPVLEKLLQLDASDGQFREMLAVSEARHDHCKFALHDFALVQHEISSHPGSLQWFGYCLSQERQFSKATSAFARLIEIVPNAPEPRFNLALLQTEVNENRAAIGTLEPLITGPSPDPDALSLASDAYEAVGDTPKAVSVLQEAIRIRPDDPDLYVRFAGLCLNHDSFDVGIDVVNAGLKQVPNSFSLYIARGLLYGQTGRYQDAENDFANAEKLNPTTTTSSFAFAATAMQKGDLGQALQTVRRQLETHPQDPQLRYMLAKVLVNSGTRPGSREFDEAMKALSLTVRLKPSFAPAHDLLASLYLQMGMRDAAIKQCRIALATDPFDRSALYRLISALRSSGNKSEVQDLVKRLLALQHKDLQQPTARERYKIMESGSNAPTNDVFESDTRPIIR